MPSLEVMIDRHSLTLGLPPVSTEKARELLLNPVSFCRPLTVHASAEMVRS